MLSQKEHLVGFWMRWRQWAIGSHERKMQMLKEYVLHSFDGYHGRANFEKSGIKWRRACAACGEAGNHRHHIIQLSRGGMNIPENIITLCRECHRTVHGRTPSRRVKGRWIKRTKLGPPRLVPRATVKSGAESLPLPSVG